jgi:hypothetical protein
MSKYGSIEQFRNIVKAVKDSTYYNGKDEEGNVLFDYTRKLPTITFTGFVKLHGTNAGIGFDWVNYECICEVCDSKITEFQSKSGYCVLDMVSPLDVEEFYGMKIPISTY